MAQILSYFPGQLATIFLQLKDSNGVRSDDGYIPVVTQIIAPILPVDCPAPIYPPNVCPPPYCAPHFPYCDPFHPRCPHPKPCHICPPPEPVIYPQNMSKIDIGLYYYQYQIPTGAAAIGSYLIDVAYLNSVDGYINNEIYQLVVTAPFGNFGTTPGPANPPPRPPPDHNYPCYEPNKNPPECFPHDIHCCPPGPHEWDECGLPYHLRRFFHGDCR